MQRAERHPAARGRGRDRGGGVEGEGGGRGGEGEGGSRGRGTNAIITAAALQAMRVYLLRTTGFNAQEVPPMPSTPSYVCTYLAKLNNSRGTLSRKILSDSPGGRSQEHGRLGLPPVGR